MVEMDVFSEYGVVFLDDGTEFLETVEVVPVVLYNVLFGLWVLFLHRVEF